MKQHRLIFSSIFFLGQFSFPILYLSKYVIQRGMEQGVWNNDKTKALHDRIHYPMKLTNACFA